MAPRRKSIAKPPRLVVNVSLLPPVFEALRAEAALRQVPMTIVVRWALNDYLRDYLEPKREAV